MTFTVTSTSDTHVAGKLILREALNMAMNNDTINFNIGDGPQTISPASALPMISHNITIDGTAPGTHLSQVIEIDGSGAGNGAVGLQVMSPGGGTTIEALVISGFKGAGIELDDNGNTITGCFIGTNNTGATALANGKGIYINNSSNNIIGGTAAVALVAGAGNLISGNTNGPGIDIKGASATGNTIENNFIGTTQISNNVVSSLANATGIKIEAGASGNMIGVVIVQNLQNVALGNLISGNTAAGILISDMGTSGNMIEGNFIGTDQLGTGQVHNHDGVVIQSMATNNVIGGSMTAAGNLISGNTAAGVLISDMGTTGNQVLDDSIGTDGAGGVALPNQTGVLIQNGAANNTIGSTSTGFGNVISGNTTWGVRITGSTVPGNKVQGNFIGTNRGGTMSVPNGSGGVAIQGGATGNVVGGTTAGATNLISGNMGDGVAISGMSTNGNFVQSNFIGTQNDGTTPLANTGNGVSLGANTANNTIGGSFVTGGANTIAANTLAGIFVDSNGNTNSSGANLNANSTKINSGTLQLTSPNAIASTSAVIINQNGMLDLNGNSDTIASLSDGAQGGGSVLLGNRTLVVGDASNTTFSGTISGGTNSTLVKAGTGTLTLRGNNTYLGTVINAGTLLIDGTHTGTEVVSAGATLGGNGIGPTSGTAGFASVSGTVSPGDNGTGILTVHGALFKTGSTVAIELKNTTLGSGYDQLAGITNPIDLGTDNMGNGIATLNLTALTGFASSVGDVFDIVSDPVGVAGTFKDRPNGTMFAFNAMVFQINYTATDVMLTHVATMTMTQLQPLNASVSAGSSVTFTATVSVVSPGTGTPTGTVNFEEILMGGGSSTLGTGTLMNGVATFNTSLPVGQHTIVAVYGGSADMTFAGSTSNTAMVTVNAGPTDHFTVMAPTNVQLGTSFLFQVTARDAGGNVDPNFSDQVVVMSSDTKAVIVTTPYIFTTGTGADNGVHTFTITLKSAGPQTVTVTDVVSNSITATANVNVVVKKDIVGRNSSTGQWQVGLSNGSTAFSSTNWATWSTAIKWANVVTGDFDGDGRTDIAGRDPATGAWSVGLSTGSSFVTSPWVVWPTVVTWVDVKVGDFNGDGMMDIAGRVLQTGRWWVSQSTGSSFVQKVWDTWSPMVTWVDVQVGDFNGAVNPLTLDPMMGLAGRVQGSGNWWVGLSTGSTFNTTPWGSWPTSVTWGNVQAGDFNGDGKTDIAGRVQQTGRWWVALSNGSTAFTSSRWGEFSTAVTWVDIKVGDFDGDGKDDIVGRVLQTGRWWVATSNGSTAFTNSVWATWSTGFTWVDVQVGDFNGDGKSDITGRALQTGQWNTGLSNGSIFTTTIWDTWMTSVSWLDVRSGNFA